MERRHCPSSRLALLQDRWPWPGSPPGGSRHGLGPGPSPSPSPEEPGAPGPGVQGYSVLTSVVGPACIFLRPSIAATQLVCTATTCLPPAPALAPRFCLSLSAGRGLSGGLTAKARGSRDVGDREAWRSRHKIKTGGAWRNRPGKRGEWGRERLGETAETGATKGTGRERTGPPKRKRENQRDLVTPRPPWPSPRVCPTPAPPPANGAPGGGAQGTGKGAQMPSPSAGMVGGQECLHVVRAGWGAPENKNEEVLVPGGLSREFLTPLSPLRTGSCGLRRLKVKGWGQNETFRVGGTGWGSEQSPGGTGSKQAAGDLSGKTGTRRSRAGLRESPAVSFLVLFSLRDTVPFNSSSEHFLGAHCGPGTVLSTGKRGQPDRSGLCPLERDVNRSIASTNGATCNQGSDQRSQRGLN